MSNDRTGLLEQQQSHRPFTNRRQAGQELAKRLAHYANRDDVLVLALPRGGVPVAFEVAKALGVDMDVFLVRKLGVPGMEELAMGAIATGDIIVLNRDVTEALDIPEWVIAHVTRKESEELRRRERAYRGDRPPPAIEGRTVILIDDGLATGATMRVAVEAVKEQKPAKIVVAVPTAAKQTCDEFRNHVDEVVCVLDPEQFHFVGMWYEDFSEVSDDEVKDLLRQVKHSGSEQGGGETKAA